MDLLDHAFEFYDLPLRILACDLVRVLRLGPKEPQRGDGLHAGGDAAASQPRASRNDSFFLHFAIFVCLFCAQIP